MSTEKQTVFVSGATGFLAQNIIKQLLETKQFKVIGSVRTEEKAQGLAKNFNNEDLSFVYVKDLADPNAFDAAFEEHGSKLDFVLHTASPVTFVTDDPKKDLIIPAENGSAGIFKAAAKYATNLKHFVMTSSIAAMMDVMRGGDPTYTLTEEGWNPMPEEIAVTNPMLAYCYSKKVAEDTVWKLSKELDVKFSVNAINPSFIFGPQAFESGVTKQLNASCELINGYTHSVNDTPIDESVKGTFVDVRDAARAHVESILDYKKFSGKRLLLSNDTVTTQIVVDILNEIPQLTGKIAIGTPHKDDQIAEYLSKSDNTKTRELLGFEFIGLNKSVKDTALQILKSEGKL